MLLTARTDVGWDGIATPVDLEVLGPASAAAFLQARSGQNDAEAAQVYTDVASGCGTTAHSWSGCWTRLEAGDSLVVWRLDRLGRSLRHLIDTVTALQARGVGFRSLQESIDTTTAGGRLIFHVFGALAEFERDLIRDRTLAGLAAAATRGRRGGRPSVMTPAKLRQARRMHADQRPVAEIAAVLGVGRATVYRHLTEHPEAPPTGEPTGVGRLPTERTP